MSLCCSRSPIHHACSDDGSLLAADARAERNGAKPSRAVVARGLRHTFLTIRVVRFSDLQQEAKTNSLVTMTGTASSSTPCPIRPFACHSGPERPAARSGAHRKNALFYRALNGARVGDLYMSLIHTCLLCAANSFDYLIELQRHAQQLAGCPAEWMPRNYRETLAQIGVPGDRPSALR